MGFVDGTPMNSLDNSVVLEREKYCISESLIYNLDSKTTSVGKSFTCSKQDDEMSSAARWFEDK